MHPDDRAAVDAAYSGSLREGKDGYEIEHRVVRRGSGEVRVVHEKCTHVRDVSGKIVKSIGMVQDITERKKAEEALVRSERRWVTTLSSIGDAVIATDLAGNVTFMNRVAEELTGWTLSEASQKPLANVFNIINEVTRKPVDDPVAKVLASDMVVGLANHTVLVRKDGSEVAIGDSGAPIKDSAGKLMGAVLVFRDITVRRNMEREMFNLAKFPGENPDPVLRASQEGVLIYANPKAKTFSGLIQAEVGEHVSEKWQRYIAQAFAFNCRVYFEEDVGDRVYLFTVNPISSGPYANIYGNDITERKKAEQALRKQAALIDLSPDGVIVKSLDDTITFWSEGAEKLYGWTKTEAIGEKACDLLKTKYRRSNLNRILEEVQEVGNWSGELVQYSKDGREVIVRSSWLAMATAQGETEILQSNIDVTEERQLQIRLEEKAAEVEEYATRMEELVEERTRSVKRQAAMIDLSPDAIIVRTLGGTINFWSAGAEKLYGWTSEEAVGHAVNDLLKTVFPESPSEINVKIAMTSSWIGELSQRSKDGRIVIVESRWLAEKDSVGRTEDILESNVDITERKKAEESALESARKLKDVERLATIGATAGMVGHDIRNPLQAIIGELFLAKTELEELESENARKSMAESIANIEKDVDYINKIVQDLQDFSKPIKPVAKVTNIRDIVDEILAKNNLPENIVVTSRISEEAHRFISDPDLLKRIVTNLISNAVQAMPKGGKLAIHARPMADEMLLSVEDTGVGIPEEARAKLFTPLFTTKSKGQGFGLAVIKRMTEALGGSVTFESEVGKGTKFIIHLPNKMATQDSEKQNR